jgi:adenylate cyclase
MTTAAACRTCGTEPLENARFCHGCGSPVQDGDTHAEYKQVTVLFADVVHSMDIGATVGAERLREIMAELIDRASTVVQRYGGTVDKFTGTNSEAVVTIVWQTQHPQSRIRVHTGHRVRHERCHLA